MLYLSTCNENTFTMINVFLFLMIINMIVTQVTVLLIVLVKNIIERLD